MAIKTIFLGFLALGPFLTTGTNVCPSNYCSMNTCPQEITECPEGYLFLANSTTCACCHSCVKIGDLDETCVKTALQNIPSVICGDDLICAENQPLPKCIQADTACLRQRSQATRVKLNISYIPECDSFGDFKTSQCFNQRCFCVDENGDRIFGSFLESQRHSINCACSRDSDQFGKMLQSLQLGLPKVQPIGYYHLQCQSNGNYQSFQLTSTHGYCVNPGIKDGRVVESIPEVTKNLKKLPCYNQGQSDFPCWTRLSQDREHLEQLKKIYDHSVGYELPGCDLDGTFKAKQCDKTSCFCVNFKGERFGVKVTIPIGSPEINQMRCNCIRDQDMLRRANEKTNWTEYDCDHLGNYRPVQCISGECFCVDSNGLPVDERRFNKTSRETIRCS